MWILFIVVSVGFKMPDNSQMLAYGINTQSNYFLISQLDTGDEINTSFVGQKKSDLSWIITEPLGGIVGGGVFGCVCGWSVWLLTYNKDPLEYFEVAVTATRIGCAVGSGIGIWAAGKYVEKEKGSLLLTLLGSSIGMAIGCAVGYDYFSLLGLPIVCSLITYRLSLKL
ncbi:MAG: hypothetical protein HY769_08990 [Candidatus Stahlbacteria bacterium]|nr:hypothetical protein [Candidatus Stahlbacteria bacterium]